MTSRIIFTIYQMIFAVCCVIVRSVKILFLPELLALSIDGDMGLRVFLTERNSNLQRSLLNVSFCCSKHYKFGLIYREVRNSLICVCVCVGRGDVTWCFQEIS